MNELQIFSDPEFGEIRTLEEHGKPLFCGSDIAKALGYEKPRNAISAHCKGALKRGILTAGGKQEMTFIPEGDVYRLITHSKLPAAEQFEHWVFDEVLPSLRQNGTYSVTPEKKALVEAKVNNSRARIASMWLKVSALATPEYRQICASHASAALAGGSAVIPLPTAERTTYSAADIGKQLGISGNMVGRMANLHALKNQEYGMMVWDRKKHCEGQVETWRYYDTVIPVLRKLLTQQTA